MTDPTPLAAGVHLAVEGPIARLTLDAPRRHNALERADVDALLAHLDRVEGDGAVRVLILTGTGTKTFCSGASLDQMESGEMTGAIFDTLTARVAGLRVPSVCALNGSVYGGGVELALCCDIRIGVHGRRMSVPAGRLGVCYPLGGIERYARRLGLAAATRILVLGEELDAEEMLRVGVLTHLVEPEALESRTDEFARWIAEQAPLAVQAMKRLLVGAAAGAVDPDEAHGLIDRCMRSDDLREGLRARRQGRAPRFGGT